MKPWDDWNRWASRDRWLVEMPFTLVPWDVDVEDSKEAWRLGKMLTARIDEMLTKAREMPVADWLVWHRETEKEIDERGEKYFIRGEKNVDTESNASEEKCTT